MRFGVSTRDALAPVVKTLLAQASSIDRWISRGRRAVFGESTGVVIPVFHAVLPPGANARGLDPAYAITTAHLSAVLDYFVSRGFTPIGLPQLVAGLDPDRNYVMFTFDDGYANNLAAIDLLEQAGVPVMLSVNPDIARSGESFWWDVLYRELHRRGATPAQIDDERLRLIRAEPAAIRRELAGRFGEDALRPIDDHDRPLTLAEVRALAARPGVSFANHTSDHQWLVGRDRDVVTVALQRAQQDLLDLVGSAPPAVTYPYGRYDDVTLDCCRSLGFEVGFGGDFGKARLPHGLRGAARLQLPRCVIFGDRSIADQCENTHTEWRLSWTIRGWMRNLRATGTARAAWP